MAAPEGRIEQVNLRDIWPNESLHFTPWLSKNLDLLGSALGMKLELVQREYQVGRYYLDILAREVDRGVLVAIENQYGWSDFSHLAQLLTYTAGLDARIAIWIAPNFEYESAEVLNWLNKWTSDEIEFYGVEVNAVRIGHSPLAADFRPVVFPGGWLKKSERPGASQRSQQFRRFFLPLIEDLVSKGFAERPRQRFDSSDRHFPSDLNKGISYAASIEGSSAWVTLHIGMEDNQTTKWVFDTLKNDQGEIESCFDPSYEWHWYRHDHYTFSSINIRRDGSIFDPPEKLEETRAWMKEHLPKFKEIFDPRLKAILENIPPAEETEG